MKCDVLINLIGSSPMPNLISSFTRIKENSTIFMIYTKETEKIARNLKRIIEEKVKNKDFNINVNLEYGLIVEEYNLISVKNQMKTILNNIKCEYIKIDNKDKSIELNFTGGTKIMSSVCYNVFQEIYKDQNAYLSYFDGEESKTVIYNFIDNKTEYIDYSRDNETINMDIIDILDCHYDSALGSFKIDEEPKISQVNGYIYESLLKYYKENKRKEFIDMLEELYKAKNNGIKKPKKYIKDNLESLNNLLENSSCKIYNIKNFSELINIYRQEFPDIKDKELYKKILAEVGGKWLENVLFQKLCKMRDDGIIDDVVLSTSKLGKNNEDQKKSNDDFEIDIIALKNERLYCISVTTGDYYESVNMKLEEIKYRAKLIGGERVKIGLVSFYENSEELRKKLIEVWDDENSRKNYLVIGMDNFLDLDEGLLRFFK